MVTYELAVLGAPTPSQVRELEQSLSEILNGFGLILGAEVSWTVSPLDFDPSQQRAAAAIFFGSPGAPEGNVRYLLRRAIPILPVVTDVARTREQIPEALWPLNALPYAPGNVLRVATALLECVGLLPRHRRVFVSYRREEARAAALQLFDALSSRLYGVFLDTHGVAPGDDFQAVLWHQLCDSDVLVMLDTQTYFDSRWTSAEFGRALAKGIPVLRVGWPGFAPSPRVLTASRVDLAAGDIDSVSGQLGDTIVAAICTRVEHLRSEGLAVRHVNLVSRLRDAAERVGGTMIGVGPFKAVHIELADGRRVALFPILGVPNSTHLHDADEHATGERSAVVFDHLGLGRRWLQHLDWLGQRVSTPRWLKAEDAAWDFADWE